MRHFIVKAIIGSFLVFVGVGAGVYVGTAISDRGTPLGIPPEILANNSYIRIGDSFPDYELKEYNSNSTTTVANLARQGPTMLLFLSTTCNACYQLADFFQNTLVRDLDENIQLVLIFDELAMAKVSAFPDSLKIPNSRIFVTDRTAQILKDGINVMPSVVGLDKQNKVKFVMTGYNRKINARFINDNL